MQWPVRLYKRAGCSWKACQSSRVRPVNIFDIMYFYCKHTLARSKINLRQTGWREAQNIPLSRPLELSGGTSILSFYLIFHVFNILSFNISYLIFSISFLDWRGWRGLYSQGWLPSKSCQLNNETSTAQDFLWSGAQNIRAARLPVPMAGNAVRWDIVKLISWSLSLSTFCVIL